MLKFLDNRTHQKPQKSPKKYNPQFLYGNSYESPKEFQSSHTIFYNSSYLNPYLNYESQRVSKFPSQSLEVIHPKWRNKVDLQSVQEQKILSPDKELPQMRHSRYLTSFHQQLQKKQNRFRKNKGQFTTFIEKNIKFKSLGPLHGDQRDETRINQTKRSVWIKPSKSMYQPTANSFLKSSEFNNSIRSSISKNSQLITEKQRIRQNRQKIYLSYKKTLQRRKFDKPNSHLFSLPKRGPQHQITLFSHTYNSNNRFSILENKIRQKQMQESQKDLNDFEIIMSQKFK